MKPSISSHAHRDWLDTKDGRQRLVTVALRLAEGTRLMPQPYERMLLDQFVRGNLTLDQVTAYLEAQERE